MHGIDLHADEMRTPIRRLLDAKSAVETVRLRAEDRGDADGELWREIASLGWAGLSVPESHGGLGLGLDMLVVLYEELGRSLVSPPALPTFLAAQAIEVAGSQAQQALWLPGIASGEVLFSATLPMAFGSGEVPVLSADGQLDGQFEYVLCACDADHYMLPARHAGALVLCLVSADANGVSVRDAAALDLTRNLGHVHLDSVRITDDAILHPAQDLWSVLEDHAFIAIAADSVAGGIHVLERTVDYMTVRTQFGRPIGSFQALKHRAAHWNVQLRAAQALVRSAAASVAKGESEASRLAAGAKHYAADVYAAVAGDAVQLHGGIGFTWEHECHPFLKRAMLNRELFGNATWHQERIASTFRHSFQPSRTDSENVQ